MGNQAVFLPRRGTTKAQIATALSTPGDPVATAAVVAAMPVVGRPNTFVQLGDSITSNGISSGGAGSRNFLAYACYSSEGKLAWLNNFGSAGFTTQQIYEGLLPTVLAMNPKPGYCLVLVGQNDYDTADATWVFYVKAILRGLITANIMPIVAAITPNGGDAKKNLFPLRNDFLARLSRDNNLPFINWSHLITDPATGGWLNKDTWTINGGSGGDDTHPDGPAIPVMGAFLRDEMLAWLNGTYRWRPPLVVYNADTSNLILNGMFLTDAVTGGGETASDGVADSWVGARVPLYAVADLVPPSTLDATDAITVGKWQRMTRVDGSTDYASIRQINQFSVLPGDRVGFGCRIYAALTGAIPPGTIGPIGIMAANQTTVGAFADATNRQWFVNGYPFDVDPATIWWEKVVPANYALTTGNFQFQITTGEGILAFAQVTYRKIDGAYTDTAIA